MLLEIFVPILLIVGSLGNLVSVYVFTRPSVKGLSTFKFLAYLSVIDFLYLFIGLPHIMSLVYFDYDFRNYSNLICSLHSFLTIYLSHLSSNVLAAVGVFRCVTITTLRPVKTTVTSAAVGAARKEVVNASFRADKGGRCPSSTPSNKENLTVVYSNSSHQSILKRLFTPKCDHTDIIVAVIVFIVFLFDFHFLIFMRLTPVQQSSSPNGTGFTCYPSANYSGVYFDFYTRIHPWIDMFLYSYIPFAIMIVSTVVIIHRLFVINKRLRKRSIIHKERLPHADMARKNRLESNVNVQNEHERMNELSSEAKRLSKVSSGDTDDQMADEQQIKPKHNQLTIPSSVNTVNHHHQHHNADNKKNSSVTSSLSGFERPIVKVSQKKKNVSLAARGGVGGSGDLAKRRSKKNGQIYKLLLTLNIFFFILVTPLVLGNSVGFLNNESTTTELVYILAYLNHCLNFLFYGFSCKIYRSILIDILKNLLHFNLRLK